MDPAQHLDALWRTRDETEGFFRQDEARLAAPYGPGRWTARQVLIHVADTESVLMDRLRRILCEEDPPLGAFDQDLWTRRLGTPSRPLAEAQALFLACRATTITLVGSMGPDDWRRRGLHTAKGPVLAEQVVAMLHGHAAHHGQQVRAVLAGRLWTTPDSPAATA